MRPVVAIAKLDTRPPQHGRIRLGIKTERAMKSIDTFRFTSVDREALEQIADLYGGTVREWKDARANPPDQFEVVTTSNKIRVFLPEGALDTAYEQWAGGGMVRRCDGEWCEVSVNGPDASTAKVACLCTRNDKMECKPKTRLSVILPEVTFGGVWRLDTGSWNAALEMPTMQVLLDQLKTVGIVEAMLCIDKREKMQNGKKKKYIVPRLQLATSALGVLQGQASIAALARQAPPAALGAGEAPVDLPEAQRSTQDAVTTPSDGTEWDDEVVDAEIVDEPRPAASQRSTDPLQTRLVLTVKEAANRAIIDPDLLRHALVRKVSEGRTTSSRDLSEQEKSKVIDLAQRVLDGADVELLSEDPPKVAIR